MKVGINGFGRIGRDVARIILSGQFENLELKAINILSDLETNVTLFRHDSLYGEYNGTIEIKDEKTLLIDGNEVHVVADRDPEKLPWGELGIDLVIESTGVFNNKEGLEKHLKAGAKKVLCTASAKNVKPIVMGVNDEELTSDMTLVSNASCTTNCLAPLTKVINENFGVKSGLMTTVHAYTNDQNITDNFHKDVRRARAAALSIIPTTTGAAKAVGQVYEAVNGKMTGYALRVPTPTVSLVDVTFTLEKDATVEEINAAVKAAADGALKDQILYATEKLVSVDYVGNSHPTIFEPTLTLKMGDQVKLVAWYDNEWGYSVQTCRVANRMAQ